MMRAYQKNSPEAVSRIVAMALISDAELDDRELEALDELDFYSKVGIDKRAFANVFSDYCRDISKSAGNENRVRPIDPALVDRALAEVDHPEKRLTVVVLLAGLMKADDGVSIEESALFNHILERWGLSPETIEST